MAIPSTTQRLEEAQKQAKTNPTEAESSYKQILEQGPGTTDASGRDYETALLGLGEIYRDQKKPQELSELVKHTRTELSSLSKAKTAKIGMLR